MKKVGDSESDGMEVVLRISYQSYDYRYLDSKPNKVLELRDQAADVLYSNSQYRGNRAISRK